jgi:hypothetical protein
MTVTPVANCDSAWRKWAESKPRVVARGELVFIRALCHQWAIALGLPLKPEWPPRSVAILFAV